MAAQAEEERLEEQRLEERPAAPAYVAIDMPIDHAVDETRVSQSMSNSISPDYPLLFGLQYIEVKVGV
jgi:hypothetical protein